jgi:hypothetical protein
LGNRWNGGSGDDLSKRFDIPIGQPRKVESVVIRFHRCFLRAEFGEFIRQRRLGVGRRLVEVALKVFQRLGLFGAFAGRVVQYLLCFGRLGIVEPGRRGHHVVHRGAGLGLFGKRALAFFLQPLGHRRATGAAAFIARFRLLDRCPDAGASRRRGGH